MLLNYSDPAMTKLSLCALLTFSFAALPSTASAQGHANAQGNQHPPRCGRTGAPNGDKTKFVSILGSQRFVIEPELQLGGFGEGPSQLAGADTVKVDRAGRIFVVDDGLNLIRVYPSLTCTGEAL